MKNKTVRGK